MYRAAHERLTRPMAKGEFWQIDSERAREIDGVVRSAARLL
jgi:hypothetical protein